MGGLGESGPQEEGSLNMCVAKKNYAHARADQSRECVLNHNYIAVFVIRRAMYELDAEKLGESDRPLWQCAQPFEVIAGKLRTIPKGRHPSHRIKGLHIVQSGDDFVVIAPDERSPEFTRLGCDLVGAGAVADNVTQIHDGIMRRRSRQRSFQSFQVAMNVTDEKYAQSSPENLRLYERVCHRVHNRASGPMSGTDFGQFGKLVSTF